MHFIEYLLLLAASFHEETISMETCLQQNANTDSREMLLKAELSRQLYNSRETQTSRNSYAHEQRELYAIESGSLELLEASWKEQYILTEKINLAKNLLVYTQSDISDIASTIGFSSQSHIGTVFRKQTGMTPAQYRKQYGNQTFTV